MIVSPIDVVSKKNDDAVVGSKGWAAYMASMSLDFLLIIVPIVLVYTVSVLYLTNYKNLEGSK